MYKANLQARQAGQGNAQNTAIHGPRHYNSITFCILNVLGLSTDKFMDVMQDMKYDCICFLLT